MIDLRRTTRIIALGAAVAAILVSARLVLDGKSHLAEARGYLRTGDRQRAIAAFEDAGKAYVPLGSSSKTALRELTILAKSAEMRGEVQQALVIWNAIRRSALSSRHFFVPYAAELNEAEQAILRLRRSLGEQKDEGDLVTRPPDPNPFLSLLLVLGLLTSLCSAFALCLLGKEDGRREIVAWRRRAWIGCLGGLGLWLLMSLLAG